MTSKLTNRLRDHATGKGSAYTKVAKSVACVWYEPHQNRKSTTGREQQIKSWSKDKKRSLTIGDSHFAEIGRRLRLLLG